MAKRKNPGKGSAFEREVCRILSQWWSGGKNDDVFWRTAGSGARATVRGRKRTFGQEADIQATDPSGQPLIDLCVIECKTGYASASIADLLDGQEIHKPPYGLWIQDARKKARKLGRPFWLLIARRHGRKTMIYMPSSRAFQWSTKVRLLALPLVQLKVLLPGETSRIKIVGTTLATFCKYAKPNELRRMAEDLSYYQEEGL